MLQQTPVARVLPAYEGWMRRWPSPAELAADPPGEAVRMWGRLGYPRRALRLHACAAALVERHDGQVPDDVPALLALPGVGGYTAHAVAAFAFGRRVPVVDTNVRRVIARAVTGHADAGPASTTRDLRAAEALLPGDAATAARMSAALMELGALVCTARQPRCAACPIMDRCAWYRAGRPAGTARRRTQPYAGTDRQVRGILLAAVRDAEDGVTTTELEGLWHKGVQRNRALHSLEDDGLLVRKGDQFHLP
ncbi:MAG: A/G-specific adenine glycosylase [Jatrophihabitans sp.]|nr:MAG: A/G-specific adenine glycosylase [Jatrophihabitans sp.]